MGLSYQYYTLPVLLTDRKAYLDHYKDNRNLVNFQMKGDIGYEFYTLSKLGIELSKAILEKSAMYHCG